MIVMCMVEFDFKRTIMSFNVVNHRKDRMTIYSDISTHNTWLHYGNELFSFAS